MRRAGWRLVARLTGSSSFALRTRAPSVASLASRVSSREYASGRSHPVRDDPLLRRLQRDERERQRALALRGIPSSAASRHPGPTPDALTPDALTPDALTPPLVNRVLAVEARTPEDVLRVVDRHGASFDPVNVATALRALHRACVRVAANGTGVDGTRRVRYAKNRRLDPVALGAKVDADPRTTTLARLALHHVDAFEPRDLAGVVRALANLHADFRVLVADTAPAASGVFATSANPANTSSLYPRLASALSTSARGFDARHCASTLGALAKLRKAHRRAFDVFDANAWRAAFVATERETVRVDARGAAEMCRALGGVGANIRATFVTASFANALARAVERTAADMDARSVAATMRGATKVKALRDALRGDAGENGSIEVRGEGSIEERGDESSTDTSSSGAWRSLTLAWAQEAPRASARDASDALAALAKLPEARDAMSPNAWTATARAVERTASSCEAPHARDAACLFAAHPGAVAAAAARRDALWPAIVGAVDANVRDMNADAVARVLDAIGRSADARAALMANPAAALRLAKAFERVARPNVGDADNVATTLFTVLGWNGDEDEGEGAGNARTDAYVREGPRRELPSRAYAYGPGDVGNVIFALARVGGGGSERISETAIGASGWGATLSDALRDAAARAHLRPAGLARAFLGLGAHEGLRRHVSDETWDALAGAFARVAARRDASAAETARIVVAVGKLPEVADRAPERAWRDVADALATKMAHMRPDHAAAVVVAVAAMPGMVAHVSPELRDAMRDAATRATIRATEHRGTNGKAAATGTETARAAKTLGLDMDGTEGGGT